LDVMSVANTVMELKAVTSDSDRRRLLTSEETAHLYSSQGYPGVVYTQQQEAGRGLHVLSKNQNLKALPHHRRLLDQEAISTIKSSVDSISSLIMNDMVVGQTGVSTTQDNFRLAAVATSGTTGTPTNFTIPLTDMEISEGVMSPSLTMTPASDTDNLKMTVSMSSSKLYESATDVGTDTNGTVLISNGLKVSLDCTDAGVSDQLMYFTVPHNEAQSFGVSEDAAVYNFTTVCKRKKVETKFYTCPDTGIT
jgi:hypothetical protein